MLVVGELGKNYSGTGMDPNVIGRQRVETMPDLPIREPSLYFGELSSDYVLVRTNTKEFHYPRGDENVFAQYEGQGGLPLGSLARRLLFAVRFGERLADQLELGAELPIVIVVVGLGDDLL
mgnify:CR=1 FL=1